jgi:hypothetical protein
MLINKEERILKIIKAIIALINLVKDNTKLVLLIIKYDLEILIPKTYNKVVNNPNYN